MTKRRIIIIILFTLSFSPAYADISGKVIAYTCFSCHGDNLTTLENTTEKLTETLLAFKNNTKNATIMDRISKGFSDAELKAVATYLSAVN